MSKDAPLFLLSLQFLFYIETIILIELPFLTVCSDDDDNSWKVRRGAVKVLAAAIAFKPQKLAYFYQKCGDFLISRFREREENVRIEVIQCFGTLVKGTLVEIDSDKVKNDGGPPAGPPKLVRMRSCAEYLGDALNPVISASKIQLKGKSVKTKTASNALILIFIMLIE